MQNPVPYQWNRDERNQRCRDSYSELGQRLQRSDRTGLQWVADKFNLQLQPGQRYADRNCCRDIDSYHRDRRPIGFRSAPRRSAKATGTCNVVGAENGYRRCSRLVAVTSVGRLEEPQIEKAVSAGGSRGWQCADDGWGYWMRWYEFKDAGRILHGHGDGHVRCVDAHGNILHHSPITKEQQTCEGCPFKGRPLQFLYF